MLNIKKLSKTFNSGTPYEKKLFDSLNLKVNKGDFITVIGSNGAGKSTLFKLISNMIESDEGMITLSGNDTTKNIAHMTAKRIGSVVQDPKLGTVGDMTVFENLSMSMLKGGNAGLRKCLIKERSVDFATMLKDFDLGLESKLDIKTKLLSGGQRQVISLLMSTMVLPDLLLLDEHTAALDPLTSAKVMDITNKVVTDNNITCMMITHKIQDAIEYGNRLIMIHEGKILMDISGEEKRSLDIKSLMDKFEAVKGAISDRQIFSWLYNSDTLNIIASMFIIQKEARLTIELPFIINTTNLHLYKIIVL